MADRIRVTSLIPPLNDRGSRSLSIAAYELPNPLPAAHAAAPGKSKPERTCSNNCSNSAADFRACDPLSPPAARFRQDVWQSGVLKASEESYEFLAPADPVCRRQRE